MNPKRSNRTIINMVILCVLCACLVLSNVLYTMVTRTHFRSKTAVMNYGYASENTRVLKASRGKILDRNSEIIAQDMNTYTIFAYLDKDRTGIGNTPAYVEDIKDTSAKIAPFMNMSTEEVMAFFEGAQASNSDLTYFGIKGKNLSTAAKESIEALDIPGIEFTPSIERYYPVGKFASSLIGFSKYVEEDKDLVGQMGLELFLNEELTGKDGEERYQASRNGTALPGTKHTMEAAENGDDVYLTLDKNVQMALETCLEKTLTDFHAQRAWAIVMEVETGKILGWAAAPTFDLNERNIEDYTNIPAQYQYEPGSVMKAFTYAGAIDANQYPSDSDTFRAGKYYMGIDANGQPYRLPTSNGALSTIQDALGKDFGTINFAEGFYRSSNVGICELLTRYFDTGEFENYLDRFGFFKPVNMEYVSEETGNKNYKYPIEKLTTGFGQGSSVTAAQMVQAYSALFNDGKMMKPYYVDRIVDGDTQEVVKQYEPTVVGQPVSKETADKMKDLMYGVMNDPVGTGYARYRMDDVTVIGKTGTGQIYQDSGYTSAVYVNSVIAAAPYKDPKVMMYYAFESGDILNFSGEPFKNAFRQALIATGVAGDPDNPDQNANKTWKESTMPQLINHTMEYATGKCNEMGVNVQKIGNGDEIINQYPKANEKVISNQNIFLLTNGDQITMPNMSGWSRKDVMTFASMSSIAVIMDGFGSVSEQSIAEGEVITKDSEITVTLK